MLRHQSMWSSIRSTVSHKPSHHRREVFESVRLNIDMEKADRDGWSPVRTAIAGLVMSWPFDLSMSVLIALNLILVIFDVDTTAIGAETPQWLSLCNIVVLIMYLVEVALKLFAFRRRFFTDRLSMFDFIVVCVDVSVNVAVMIWPVSLAAPVVLARVARILKVTRALRMMAMFPELNLMMRGLMLSAKTVVWGVFMLGLLLCFWGIFAVLFIHPIVQELDQKGIWGQEKCTRCPRAFSSVGVAMLTLCQQLVLGEDWGKINTPLMEERPETVPYFILVLVSVPLAALNLLLGVIVERATEAGAETLRDEVARKEAICKESSRRLYEVCQELDTDRSGRLTFEGIFRGFECNGEFSDLLRVMDIDERDLGLVFTMMDVDGSGDVDYQEFVEQLHLMNNQSPQTLLIFIKYYVMDMRIRIGEAFPPRAGTPSRRPSILGFLPLRPVDSHDLEVSETPSPSQAGTEVRCSAAAGLDCELHRLDELRRELLDASKVQADRLDDVFVRLAGRLDAMRPERVALSGQQDARACAPRPMACGDRRLCSPTQDRPRIDLRCPQRANARDLEAVGPAGELFAIVGDSASPEANLRQ